LCEDLVVFHFVLHEINPVFHSKAISIACQLAPKIAVVEPSPKGCKAFEKYWKLWKGAMNSIGRFEDYKPLEYWKSILERDFNVRSKVIQWRVDVPFVEFKKII